MSRPFLTRVSLKNYRSIAQCEVELGPLTFLVGPNGAGKSNFLDALRLTSDALRTTLDHALRDRGGIGQVRRRSGGHPTHFTIRLDFAFGPDPDWPTRGHYTFSVGAKRDGGFDVAAEECVVEGFNLGEPASATGTTLTGAVLEKACFRVERGKVVVWPTTIHPPASDDRLYLVQAAGQPAFRGLFDALTMMGFYNLNPDSIRALQSPDRGDLLARDGRNLASVLDKLIKAESESPARITDYLAAVVPGVVGVTPKRLGHMETLEFKQAVEGAHDPWRFDAMAMSDGTLRALGILVALLHAGGAGVPLVGIEEPEVALHPAAAGVLRDVLRDASRDTQVLVTSHSPDLLDDSEISPDAIRVVFAEQGKTAIRPLDEVGASALRDRLYTPGELLRANQLQPSRQDQPHQLNLFEIVGS